MKKLTALLLVVGVITILFGVLWVYAGVTVWEQTISWDYQEQQSGFTVDRTSNPIDYGLLTEQTEKTESYTITNAGNVQITVAATATPTGASASWNQASATIPVEGSATFVLTLTITGSGSCTVRFEAT